MRIGAVLVPINTRFRTEDAAYVLGQSDSSTLVITARSGPIDYLGMVRTLLPTLGSDAEAVSDPKLPALQRVIVLSDGPVRERSLGRRFWQPGRACPTTLFAPGPRPSRCTSWCAASWSARSIWGITPADTIPMYLPLSPPSGPLKQPQGMTGAENLAQAPARRLS